MNNTSKALYTILISLGLAFIFNYLFFDKLIGVSVLVFIGILLGTVFLFSMYHRLALRKSWWLALLILFFASMPAVTDSEFLIFLNVVATFGLLMLLAHQLAGTPVFVMRIIDYFILAILVPFRMLGRAMSAVALVSQIHSTVKHRDVWIRVLKGIIMALPILIIFGALFSQADLAFSQFIKNFVDINITEQAIQYTVLLAFTFVAALCFLSYIFLAKASQSPASHNQSGSGIKDRETEVMVFLGLIATLFFLFIGFQITYLFGGQTNIVEAGFTYAEYARRGFGELVAVVVISLLILLASEKYSGSESKRNKKFMIPGLILIAEVIVIIASAFKRLSLYVDAYSMTEPRFYAAVFILLLLVLFILLLIKFIKLKQEQFFASGTLLSVLVFLIAVNVINPDSFIAQSNLEQYNRTGKIDVLHVGRLSADAEQWKINLYNRLQGEDKETLRGLLQKDREDLEKGDDHWQSTNLSRSRALKLLQTLE